MRCLLVLTVMFSVICHAAEDPPAPVTRETEIERLISKLSDPSFDERERAAKALKTAGPDITKLLLTQRKKSEDPEMLKQIDAVLEHVAPLDYLLALYEAYGLPLPPAAAPLVRVHTGWKGEDENPLFALDFLISKEPLTFLVGTQMVTAKDRKDEYALIQPDAEAAHDARAAWRCVFEFNCGLATALQCHARGWKALSKKILEQPFWGNAVNFNSTLYQPANLSAKTALAKLAWAHWENELIRPGTDRLEIYKRMKTLHKENPDFGESYLGSLLESLEQTVAPKKSAPGSVEALIDDLTELSTLTRSRSDKPDEKVVRILALGFDAIPALMAHADDIRLTRTYTPGVMRMPTHHKTIKEMVRDILQDLCDGDPATLQEWWAKAQRQGEEAYLLEHVLPRDPKKEWPNHFLLRMLSIRYPKDLPKIYRTVLEQRPQIQSWPICDAIAESALLAEEKKALFLMAARHSNLVHRSTAFWKLKNLDHENFVELLVATLQTCSKKPKGPFWKCGESSFANLVAETKDPRAWKALLAMAQRVDVGLRMEFMNPMDYTYIEKRQFRQRLWFLAHFLQDETIRDKRGKEDDGEPFDGPHAAFTIPVITVQDFAARQLASLLDLNADPKADWKAEQWSFLREAVRKKLADLKIEASPEPPQE